MTHAHEYHLLAIEHPIRGERLNVGVMLWDKLLPRIHAAVTAQRLAALDPNLPRLPVVQALLDGKLQDTLWRILQDKPQDLQARKVIAGLIMRPIEAGEPARIYAADEQELAQRIEDVLDACVRPVPLEVKAARKPQQRPSRLHLEIRAWLKQHHAYSVRAEDIGKNKVVANYPLHPQSDLYADLAVMNGALHAVEVLDLRNSRTLTNTLRGQAAIKGITLDAAREHVDGKRLAVFAAGDYSLARPAIAMFGRYADQVLDLGQDAGQKEFAKFIATALHRDELPAFNP